MQCRLSQVPPFAREEAPKLKFTKKQLEPAKQLPARGERTGVRTNSKEKNFRPFQKKRMPCRSTSGVPECLTCEFVWVPECPTGQLLGRRMPDRSIPGSRNALQIKFLVTECPTGRTQRQRAPWPTVDKSVIDSALAMLRALKWRERS